MQQKLTSEEIEEKYPIGCQIFVPLTNEITMCPCGCGYGYCEINEKWYNPELIEGLKTEWVVNIKSDRKYDVYIGRQTRTGLKKSKWHNPFIIGKDGDRETIIEMYREYLKVRPDLIAALPELKGKMLGCWCKPDACHGDILAELANKKETK
jgi:hypothetical protein